MLNLQVTPLRLQGWSEDLLFIRHLQELAKSDLVLLHALRTIRGHHIITEKRRLRRTLCRAMSASTMVKTSKIMLRLAQAIIFLCQPTLGTSKKSRTTRRANNSLLAVQIT